MKTKTKSKRGKRADIARPFCSGQWTNARFFQFIRTALRRASSRWQPAYACLKKAETTKLINKKTGRLAMHYQCALCCGEFPRKEVNIDHIVPAGSLSSFDDLPGFAQRLFCEIDGFRVLCIECHAEVTKEQKSKSC